jgi:hypothetical protein
MIESLQRRYDVFSDNPGLEADLAGPPAIVARRPEGVDQVGRVIEFAQQRRTNLGPSVIVPGFFETRFELHQKWEGRVEEIDAANEVFSADLRALTPPEAARESADLGFDLVSVDDQPLLRVGAVFYLSIGYRIERGGTRYRSVNVRFRRLPAWTTRDLEAADAHFEELERKIGHGQTKSAAGA